MINLFRYIHNIFTTFQILQINMFAASAQDTHTFQSHIEMLFSHHFATT